MTRDYSHPYSPYKIQNELMDAIYDTVDGGFKIGLFESPTGTGKTLSIICATMTWLREFKRDNDAALTISKELDTSEDEESSEDEPEWVKTAHRKSVLSRTKGKAIDYEKHLQDLERNIPTIHEVQEKKRKPFKKKKGSIEEEGFIPDDYYSDSEVSLIEAQNIKLSVANSALINRISGNDTESLYPPECPHPIIFASRTHSQLSQFAHQLRLTSFLSSLEHTPERTKFVSLGSRKQLCINPKVRQLGDLNSMNDACVDLQKKECSCEYYPKPSQELSLERTKSLVDNCFTEVRDIEDLAGVGNQLHVCPYYAIRSATDLAEVVALPYQLLFLRNTRDSIGLNIKNSIVVIDEAHNLMDTISSMNSVTTSVSDFTTAITGLKQYLNKFARRLNSGNRIHLIKLIKLCQVVEKFMTKPQKYKPGDKVDPLDIFQGNTGDMINVHKLNQFLIKSKIAYKIESYIEHTNEASPQSSSSNPILFKITHFLECLANTSEEGQIIWNKTKENVSLQYILLDPSVVFEEVSSQAKCILLCGGTMEPMNDFMNFLFPKIPQNLIKTFTCDHLIPKENLQVFTVGSFNDKPFEFSFDKRFDTLMIHQLGIFTENLLNSVPSGVVIFFPSYKYLNHVFSLWSTTGVLDKISRLKTIFQEPKDSQEVERTLLEYSYEAKSGAKGAALFAVVGGKMAEGINFSDDLARGVVIIGLPFPNAFAVDLIAKRNHIIKALLAKGKSQLEAINASRDFYENICMRAVNQSIGRSIRHANDYSTIFLVDQRYSRLNIKQKLSKWVRDQLPKTDLNVNEVFDATARFFEYHKIIINK